MTPSLHTLALRIDAHRAEGKAIRELLDAEGPGMVKAMADRYGRLRDVTNATDVNAANLSYIRSGQAKMSMDVFSKLWAVMGKWKA